MSQYINEAFKQFRMLNESEDFSLDPMGLDNLNSFMDKAMEDDDDDLEIDIIDPETTEQDELKQSYIGKVICDCNVCHSNIFYNKEDITVDEDGVVNVEDECPYCMSNDGYTIVGEIKPYEEISVEDIDEPEDDIDLELDIDEPETDEPIEIEDEKIEESLINEDSLDDSGVYHVSSEDLANKKPDTKFSVKTDGKSKTVMGKDLPDHFPNATLKVSRTPGEQDTILDVKYDMEEGLQLSGEKELKGTSDLRHRDDKEGSDKIRGKNNTKLSGDLDLHESKDNTDDSDEVFEAGQFVYIKPDERSGIVKSKSGDVYTVETIDGEEKNLPDRIDTYYSSDLKLTEDINNITIDSDDESIIINNKEDGGVVVETSPTEEEVIDEPVSDNEMIAPLDDETVDELGLESEPQEEDTFDFDETESEEEPGEDTEDVDIDEFDEDSFDDLGESYLRRCYENVNGFKTTKVTCNESQIMVEGNISFKSGNVKKTNFIFEAKEVNNGKYVFEGYNDQINIRKNAYRLNCSLDNKKLISESLTYNYSSKNELNESVKVSGTVKSQRGNK